jgi:hypothetical protein
MHDAVDTLMYHFWNLVIDCSMAPAASEGRHASQPDGRPAHTDVEAPVEPGKALGTRAQ